jgi:hypothetical protein
MDEDRNTLKARKQHTALGNSNETRGINDKVENKRCQPNAEDAKELWSHLTAKESKEPE